MKIKLIIGLSLLIFVITILLYLLYPQDDFAERDDIILKQISFLINSDIEIKDFSSQHQRIPNNLSELLERNLFLKTMYDDINKNSSAIEYMLLSDYSYKLIITNKPPRLNLELRQDGQIIKHR